MRGFSPEREPIAERLQPGEFEYALLRSGRVSLIAEYKRRSPFDGEINEHEDVRSMVRKYEQGGAAAVSILTQEEFGGSVDDVWGARCETHLPILAKGIYRNPEDFETLRKAGATAALIVVRKMGPALDSQIDACHEAGLEPVVEVFDETDVARAFVQTPEPKLVLINNRDLATGEIDPTRAYRVEKEVPNKAVAIVASGIFERSQMAWYGRRGRSQAALVGTSLMRAEDPEAKVRELVGG